MTKIFWAIVGKELIAFIRSWQLVFVVLYAFSVEVYIAGSGIEINPRNVAVGYVDLTGGGMSQKILTRLHAPEFLPPKRFDSQQQLSRAIFNKEIIIGIVFNADFEKNWRGGKRTQLDVLVDATAASQAYTTLGYLQNIVLDLSGVNLLLEIASHKLFNPNADNHTFMALTEMLSIITMLTVILTAVVFVREKEQGTWDIMLLMPVDPKLIILAKSFSQVIIVMVGIVISLGFVVFGMFETPMNGSFAAFMVLSFFYVFATAGIGLFIAAVARDVMQVAQLSIIIMMPMIFLSGAWTPIHAMHPLLQLLSYASPLRYYIEGSESIFYRGTQWGDLWPYFLGVTAVGGVMYAMGFRKIGRLF
ncbi:MAG: ABC transporter permease [Sulfuricurvum sp.]|jgi:ABC-2 type transport system permease protein|uniref:ABC transporter permease n=1 Tax=Sulfuricurvum sp. TaxID=2025608 RepID=UPI0025F335F0|nr:ABC transporter permease [Sulfuricurvum sp.]MCK9373261.1 ABC transporter permease [Sulfuricurvum sp.]